MKAMLANPKVKWALMIFAILFIVALSYNALLEKKAAPAPAAVEAAPAPEAKK